MSGEKKEGFELRNAAIEFGNGIYCKGMDMGAAEGVEIAANMILKKAGELFGEGKDREATMLRELAREISASSKLLVKRDPRAYSVIVALFASELGVNPW